MRRLIILAIFLFLLLLAFVSGQCKAEWFCQGEWRTYHNSECQIINRDYCKYGCEPGGCIEIEQCPDQWTCNGNFREHQNIDCEIDQREFCSEGCRNTTCRAPLEIDVGLVLGDRKNYFSFDKDFIFNFSHYREGIESALKLKECGEGHFKAFSSINTDPSVHAVLIMNKSASFEPCLDNFSAFSGLTAQLILCTWKQDKHKIRTLSSNNNIREKFCNNLNCPSLEECETIKIDRITYEKPVPVPEIIIPQAEEITEKKLSFVDKIVAFLKSIF